MSRVVRIVLWTGFVLALILVALVLTIGPAALERGTKAYADRELEKRDVLFQFPNRPRVYWMGDSTIAKMSNPNPYPHLIEAALESEFPIESVNRSRPGADPYVHYMRMGQVLKADPVAIFIVANLRIMRPITMGRGILQLASFVPRSELPAASLLPWYGRSTTFPRVLLARTMSWSPIEKGVYTLDGAREMFHDALWTSKPARRAGWRIRNLYQAFRRYDTPITRFSPMVRMLAASVRMAVRHGVSATVIVAPVPVARLAKAGFYGPQFGERVEVLRSVVEGAGGHLIDLHAELVKSEFRDLSGHYNAQGAAHLADLLAPIVRERVESGM